ncbi:hypothetical protein COCOBI_05-0960 [Coccomyxa sp. Obi]|nr:hypothetical protein COCOBI_05-0960 [Coccomyxa sp. Obi]
MDSPVSLFTLIRNPLSNVCSRHTKISSPPALLPCLEAHCLVEGARESLSEARGTLDHLLAEIVSHDLLPPAGTVA